MSYHRVGAAIGLFLAFSMAEAWICLYACANDFEMKPRSSRSVAFVSPLHSR